MTRKFEKISPLELAVLLLTALFAVGTLLWFLLAGPRQEVQVVKTGELSGQLPQVEAPGILPGEKIDLNTASPADLTRLPGIGEGRAEAIAAWREENGPFAAVEDIMNVSGIGEGVFEGLKDYVTVGETAEEGASHGEDPGS